MHGQLNSCIAIALAVLWTNESTDHFFDLPKIAVTGAEFDKLEIVLLL